MALDTTASERIAAATVTGLALGRKFEATDINDSLRMAANAYALQYSGTFEYMLDMRNKASRYGLTPMQAKGVLNCLMAEAKKAPAAKMAIEDAGVYVLPDGSVAKVQANKAKTNTYALRWVVIGGTRLTEKGEVEQGEYQYEGGLVKTVAATGRKMTLEEAKAFILRYGQCARCGRKLVAAKSVQDGIGPVCITYFGGFATEAPAPKAPKAADPAKPMAGKVVVIEYRCDACGSGACSPGFCRAIDTVRPLAAAGR